MKLFVDLCKCYINHEDNLITVSAFAGDISPTCHVSFLGVSKHIAVKQSFLSSNLLSNHLLI